MLQDREEGELSSEETEGAEMRETREDLEEGEVDEGEHPAAAAAAAGYGQPQYPGGFQGSHSQQRMSGQPKQHQQRLGKQQQPQPAKAKFRPEAMIVFGLHQLSPHALNTLVKRYEATQWAASHPEPFEAFLGDKFNDAMIAHILQQVHTTHMTDPQNDAMLFFHFPTQTAKHKLLKFLKDLGIERLSTKSPKGVQIDVLLGAIGAPMAPVPPPPPVAPMPMEPGHYEMMPPNPWGMHDEFGGGPPAHHHHHHPHHMSHHGPMHDLAGHAPYYYNPVDVGVMHPVEAHMHPLAPPMAHVPPPAGNRWKRPRNVNAGPPMGAYDGPPRQHMLKKSRLHSQSRERHSEPEAESPVELEEQEPEKAAVGGESQADLDQLRNLVLLSMARKASETERQVVKTDGGGEAAADAQQATTSARRSPPPPSNGVVQTVSTKPVRPARARSTPSPTPSSWSSSGEAARPGAASNRTGTPAVPRISALRDTIEFTFKHTERVHRDLFDIYGAMNVAQLPMATCDAEFWPTKKSDAKPLKPASTPAVAGKQPKGTAAAAVAATVVDPVELKRQELLAKAEEMKRQIQLEEQKRKRKLTVARSQSSEQADAPQVSHSSSVPQAGRVDAESAAASTTKRHDTAAVQSQPVPEAPRPAAEELANAIEPVPSPAESTVVQAESKEAEFERLKKREQQLKTEIMIRQLKAEIDAHEAELKDALAKLAQARELLDGLHIATNEQEKLVSKLRVEKLELTQKAVKSDAYRIELLSELANARQALIACCMHSPELCAFTQLVFFVSAICDGVLRLAGGV